MFDGVEVWGVGWQVKEGMASVLTGFFHLRPLMERSVVHDDHAFFWKFRKQVLFDPRREDGRVDIGLEQADGEQGASQQSADGVRPSFGAPIVCSKTALAA